MTEKVVKVLLELGADDIRAYDLCNNYGYTFNHNGKKYDVRYWANCYGVALNRWSTHMCEYVEPTAEEREFMALVDSKANA